MSILQPGRRTWQFLALAAASALVLQLAATACRAQSPPAATRLPAPASAVSAASATPAETLPDPTEPAANPPKPAQSKAVKPLIEPSPPEAGEFERLATEANGGRPLLRFGSQMQRSEGGLAHLEVPARVPPRYAMQVGDELTVNIWGSVDAEWRLRVDRSGRVTLPRVGPVAVAGAAASDLEPLLRARLERVFKGFELSAAVTEVSPLRVHVTGFVERPGDYIVPEIAFAFDPAHALAPLPRAWQWLDGSAFQSHGDLMSTVFGLEKQPHEDRPLMYQGLSDRFLASTADVPFPSSDDGIDFEGEFGVITDRVPMGTRREQAMDHVRLIVLINDWSLRRLAPIEMKTGFGWIQAKPASSMAPIAVTPDELGKAWRDGCVHMRLEVDWNGRRFGAAHAGAMAFGFDQLIAHAAYSRDLVAGTVLGSGTVSNENYRVVGSSCIAERRAIELLDEGQPRTPYMQFGDHVRMQARHDDDRDGPFGMVDQRVVRAGSA